MFAARAGLPNLYGVTSPVHRIVAGHAVDCAIDAHSCYRRDDGEAAAGDVWLERVRGIEPL